MDKFFLDPFLNRPIEDFKHSEVVGMGMVLDWLSHISGRTILVGTLTYESHKNYKSKKEFEEKVLSNPLNKPTVIFIHDWYPHNYMKGVSKFKNFDNLFNRHFEEIEKIENRFIFNIKPPEIKKNGKPEKHFNVQRKKPFGIKVVNGMSSDMRIIDSTTISCTFRDFV